MTEEIKKGRELAPDLLKLLACVGVVVIHISGQGVTSYALGSGGWYACVFWDSLARFAVPVFFMCTGALMLPPSRELTVGRIYKKYFLRVLVIAMFWAWAYYVFTVAGTYVLSGWHEENWFLKSIVETLRLNHHLHLYYLQILLLVYALLPALRVFTRQATDGELRYACAVWLALGIALPLLVRYPPFSWLGGLVGQYSLNMCWSAPGYALAGYYLSTLNAERGERRKYLLLLLAGFGLTFGGTAAASVLSGAVDMNFMEGMSPGPCAMAVGLFGYVRCVSAGGRTSPRLARLVKASFAVYLIHHGFIMVFRQLGIDVHLFAPILEIPLETAAVLALSLAGWWVLDKIPFVKDHLI